MEPSRNKVSFLRRWLLAIMAAGGALAYGIAGNRLSDELKRVEISPPPAVLDARPPEPPTGTTETPPREPPTGPTEIPRPGKGGGIGEPPKPPPPEPQLPEPASLPPAPATPASAEPAFDIAAELRRINQKLQNNPGYPEALEAYAGPVLDAILAQRAQTYACEAIVHWRQYAEGPCQHVDSKFTQVVARKLPALLRLCPSERLPQAVLLRCKSEPVL